MGMSSSSGGGTVSDINVTPLVDVMLVLLIIFMVSAPMLAQDVTLDLPKETAVPLKMDEDQLILKIDKEHNYFLRATGSEVDTPIAADELAKKLAAIAKANPDLPIFLEADGDVPYGHVALLLAAAQAAGLPRVGLVFDPGGEPEEAP